MTTSIKIDQVEVAKFMIDYIVGDHPHQRVGQAFLNTLLPSVVDPELFYEENVDRAWEIIVEKYVDFGV